MKSIPFGYQIINGRKVIDKEKAETVHCIFHEYVLGMSLGNLAQKLTEEQRRTSNNGTSWNHGMISRILDNQVYVGKSGFPAIISTEIFVTAQNRRAVRAEAMGRTNKSEGIKWKDYFEGKLFCATCGSVYKRYKDLHGRKTNNAVWKCKNYINNKNNCLNSKVLSDDVLVNSLTEIINRLIKNPFLVKRDFRPVLRISPSCHITGEKIAALQFEKEKNKGREKEIMALALQWSSERYQTLSIQDYEWKTQSLIDFLKHKELLQEFDEETFNKLIKKVLIEENDCFSIECLNGTKIVGILTGKEAKDI